MCPMRSIIPRKVKRKSFELMRFASLSVCQLWRLIENISEKSASRLQKVLGSGKKHVQRPCRYECHENQEPKFSVICGASTKYDSSLRFLIEIDEIVKI